jgi:hypothetical protein
VPARACYRRSELVQFEIAGDVDKSAKKVQQRVLGRARDGRSFCGGKPPRRSRQRDSVVILLIGMAVGVDYSLFYLRRERE